MSKLTVLVADDIFANQFLLASYIDMIDPTIGVRMVSNGKEAFDVLEKEKIDVIFMDIEMPVMNGIEATKKLKSDSKYSSIPVVAITAHNLEDFASEFGDAGFDTILEKPYSEETVLEVLKNLKLL